MQEAVRLVYKNNDILYVSIHSLHKISKYIGKEGDTAPQLSKIGSDAWKQLKARTKKQNQGHRGGTHQSCTPNADAAPGHAFPPDDAICRMNWRPVSCTRTRPTRSNPRRM
jgi:transcription-repair coupling factor (superfamily II helicase)